MPSHKQISKKGGKSKLQKYGKQVYSEMGKKGYESKVKKYGKDYGVKLASQGREKQLQDPNYRINKAIKLITGRLKAGLVSKEAYDKTVAHLESKRV